jgi:predicted RNA-binding Zn ribbon-like protein
LFAHHTEVALSAAVALVNTAEARPDGLATVRDLNAFVAVWGAPTRRVHGAADLHQVRALRPRLRQVWRQDVDAVVRSVNELLRDAGALPQLTRSGDWDYRLHASSPDAPVASRLAIESAMAIVDVVRAGELERLRVCTAEDCDNVLVDLSKNRSRRYCDAGCGNRANVAAYRARRRA